MPDDGSYLQSYDSSHGIAQLMRELFPGPFLFILFLVRVHLQCLA
jgi:hypothetical protein